MTAQSGVTFTHVNGSTGELLLPEVIGSGGALFDYDNDGDLDLFAVQGSALPPAAPGPADTPRSRLYRNDLDGANRGRLRFTDVTSASGLAFTAYGMGAATGDFNNDGWVDLYVTALGSNRLFRNNGDGTFTDVTAGSGTADARWSTSASFFDYDRDGWLDLFVAHYVDFSSDDEARLLCGRLRSRLLQPRGVFAGRRSPAPQQSRRDVLGCFRRAPASRKRLPAASASWPPTSTLDGWMDVYVANDGDPNQLWINRGNGTFSDEALLAGVALNRAGQAQGSMGVDLGGRGWGR